VKGGNGREMAGQFGLLFRLPRKLQGSCTCRKPMTWDRRLYFLSDGRHAVDFFVRKIRRLRPGSNPRSWVQRIVGTDVLIRDFDVRKRRALRLLLSRLSLVERARSVDVGPRVGLSPAEARRISRPPEN
jgi:hypothetical protein